MHRNSNRGNEKMKIWLLQANEPIPIVSKGQRLFRMGMLAQTLQKGGHEIIWFSNTFDHFQKKQLYNKDETIRIEENYTVNLIWAPGYKKNISIKRIINHKYMAIKFRKMAKKLEKPDLIYTSFPTIEFAEEAVKYGKKNNVPVIVDIRDLWPDIFNHNLSGIKKIMAFPYIQLLQVKTKKIMRNAFAINGISPEVVNWGLKKAKREKNIFDKYFYMGYDKLDVQQKENKNTIDKEKFNISFFATINNQFDYDKIIELAKKMEEKDKEVFFNICGDGPQLEELKRKTKNITNIKLLGWVGKSDIDYILTNSKIGLAPYKNTFDFQMSVSNKFAEYISYGLPIVMTSQGYMGELLKKNNCGIASQDINKLCEYIVNLKKNKEKYDIISQNAKRLYEKDFVASKIYQELADYLEKICKKGE